MTAATIDTRTVLGAIDRVAERLIAMVLRAPDLDVRLRSGSDWTVREAFAHVVTVTPRYTAGTRGVLEVTETPAEVCGYNARENATVADLDVEARVARLRAALAELGEVIEGLGDDPPSWRFHGGAYVRADVALGALLGELVVHGWDIARWDIARALREHWPIDPQHVELIHRGVLPVLPGWLDDSARGHTGSYEVRLRGQGVHRFAFRDGRLDTDPRGPWRPDVVLSGDPATVLLVMYKRRSQWPGILTGRLVAYGRKPWLAVSFAGRIHRP